ncbi:glycosyltransferase [Siminovitchia sp. FSL H7-0308]|uniref:Cellulose synthase/poly-beta-1,6-N-acetylglucosamine synthase-like glycosyltransferase n=1 Tax=Siminovitchia thermophila TaxID=1245522 RepID=A0ABS2R7X2_9BACI|nr:glycosyltransferase [Siminovitchia thermophila]MBM7715748.1 cellulose synthase/poly-beta-1,6-N-acetylglucosamine synthase-like glycosyltransferase [Siminovitchia thermophila]ONK23586.1 glycosyl transferase [Bacillus sp. VT-16-64]
MGSLLELLMKFFSGTIIFYMMIVIVTYGSMLILAFIQLRKQYLIDKNEVDEDDIDAFYSKPVSIIVPAYNEEAGIIDSIHSILSLRYPQIELIIVNDGSTDNTQRKIIEQFRMKEVQGTIANHIPTKPIRHFYQSDIHPNVWLIEKENGGKADALNVGINASRYPYFCTIDADSILEENALLRVMNPIIKSNDEVIAAGGTIRIANGLDVQLGAIFQTDLSKNALVVMQVVEYVRAFLMGRIALSTFNLMLIVSGAFSVFSKKWVVAVGGYSTDMIGEDMELVVKLHRRLKEEKVKKRIQFVPDPVCWTETPQDFQSLRNQRKRWYRGLIESLWKHRKMTLNPKFGAIGMVSFPYFWFVECLGPLIELAGYFYIVIAFFLGDIYYEFAILLILLFVLYGVLFTVATILLEAWTMNTYPKFKDLMRLLFISLTEMFWYRPITLFYKCEGFITFLLGKKEWGHMERVGLSGEGKSK